MAGGARLTPGAGTRLLALLAVVLLLHVLALQWLARQLEQPALLRPMATPMFTRLLQQQAAPAVPPPPATQAVRARPRRSTVTTIAKPAAPVASEASRASSAATSDLESPSASREPETEAAATPAADSSAQPPPPETEVASAPDAGTGTSEAAAASADTPAGAAAPATEATPAPAGPESTAMDSWPADTRLNYRLGGHFRGELHGNARVQWQRQANRYETRVDIELTLLASLVLTSQGEVTVHGLLPKVYEELRRSGPRGVRLGDETITLANGRSVPRPEGVQDTASQFVELSHRFATGQSALEVGRSVSFWLARPGAVDLWTYDIVNREILQTPQLGAVEAFHLKPRPIANPRGNITAELWFAPSLQYLPVRIRVSMGDATYVDLIVDRIEQR